MKRTDRRIIALLLAALVLLVFGVSSAFIAHASEHDCTGEDCAICAHLAEMQALVRQLCLAALGLCAAFLRILASQRRNASAFLPARTATPVALRVRPND